MESNIGIAIAIKNETKVDANTAGRVGGLLESMCNDLQTLFDTPSGIVMNPVEDYIGTEKVAPAISLFNCVTQPSVFDGVVSGIQPKEAGAVSYTGIYYASDLKIFVAKSGNDYYTIWGNMQDYDAESLYVKNGKALFKIYYNKSDSSLYALNKNGLLKLSQGYMQVVPWSGKVVDDARVIESGAIGSDPGNIVFVKSVNTFAYQKDGSYYAEWTNRADFQRQVYMSSVGQRPMLFRNNMFKGLDGSLWVATDFNTVVCVSENEHSLSAGDIVLPDKSTMSPESYKSSGLSDAIGVVIEPKKGLYVRKGKYTGILTNGTVASEIFYAKVGCQEPYDGRVTQKMNLLHSSAPSTHFPVFSYAENNGCYVASNGELDLIYKVRNSLDLIGSDLFASNLASCTQNPLNTTVASVFYGGGWRTNDVSNPSSSLSYALIDIL